MFWELVGRKKIVAECVIKSYKKPFLTTWCWVVMSWVTLSVIRRIYYQQKLTQRQWVALRTFSIHDGDAETYIFHLGLIIALIIYIYSVYLLVSDYSLFSRWKYISTRNVKKFPVMVHVLRHAELVISSCCFAEDHKEMYRDL